MEEEQSDKNSRRLPKDERFHDSEPQSARLALLSSYHDVQERDAMRGAQPGSDSGILSSGHVEAAAGTPPAGRGESVRMLAAYMDLGARCRLEGDRVTASVEMRGLRIETRISGAGVAKADGEVRAVLRQRGYC